nr:hypothetical protein CFP56_41258 [Quercus suber]
MAHGRRAGGGGELAVIPQTSQTCQRSFSSGRCHAHLKAGAPTWRDERSDNVDVVGDAVQDTDRTDRAYVAIGSARSKLSNSITVPPGSFYNERLSALVGASARDLSSPLGCERPFVHRHDFKWRTKQPYKSSICAAKPSMTSWSRAGQHCGQLSPNILSQMIRSSVAWRYRSPNRFHHAPDKPAPGEGMIRGGLTLAFTWDDPVVSPLSISHRRSLAGRTPSR